jgi:hypothetical protein
MRKATFGFGTQARNSAGTTGSVEGRIKLLDKDERRKFPMLIACPPLFLLKFSRVFMRLRSCCAWFLARLTPARTYTKKGRELARLKSCPSRSCFRRVQIAF